MRQADPLAHAHSDFGHRQILAAQIRLLYANADVGCAVTILAATILSRLQWGSVPNAAILGWWVYITLVTIGRAVLARRYRHAASTWEDIDQWAVAFAFGAGLAGAGWGAAGVLLYSETHLVNQVFLVFILGGMMLGAGSLLAPRREAFLAFLIPTGIAPTIRLFAQGDQGHIAMGILAAAFTVATLVSTGRISRTLAASLALQFENQDLVEHLQAAQKETDFLNQALEHRVQERTAELQESTEQLRAEILQREQVEQELFRARQLESLGVLAGGIAHDFNNFLTIVQGNLEMAQANLSAEEPAQELLDQAATACRRAANLSHQLLTFATGGAPVRRVVSVAKLVMDAVQLARTGAPTSFAVNIADDLRCAEVDPGQIGQVLHNILLNARQAMAGEGIIEVRAENVATRPDAGPVVRISMRDYGCGIAPDVLPRIFEPYFTTKAGSSGLGLATAYAIVAKHQGRISVESHLGHWTEFTIDLPSTSETPAVQVPISPSIAAGSERLLVMDDEEAIRSLLKVVLSQLGYEVQTARDGAEAIALYERAMARGRRFEAVLLDLTVSGGMGGLEAASKLKELDPYSTLIVSSGYSDSSVMSDFVRYGFDGVIPKPWTAVELGAVFARVLAGDRKTQ